MLFLLCRFCPSTEGLGQQDTGVTVEGSHLPCLICSAAASAKGSLADFRDGGKARGLRIARLSLLLCLTATA